METKPPQQYVINADGERIGIILPIADYQAIIDELERLAAIAENRADGDIIHPTG